MPTANPAVAVATRLLRSRRLMRAPIWFYRLRLGPLLGPRLLMLEHVGRKSGAARYVMLEVIDHPTPDRYIVASGFGAKAQWFRNIQANPQVRVSAGIRFAAPAVARVLTQQEADETLASYIARYPRLWARFKAVLEKTLETAVTETNTPLPLVELRLDAPTLS